MPPKLRLLLPSLAAVALAIALSPAVATAAGDGAKDCISFSGVARFGGVGFTHVVHVANACSATATCAVSTDVTPTPQSVTVPGKQSVDVVTYLDSPASKFTPHVTCTMGK